MDDLAYYIVDGPMKCMRLSKDNDVLVGLHSNSWLGRYLRQLALKYKQFDFSSRKDFFKQFLSYRSQSLDDRRCRYPRTTSYHLGRFPSQLMDARKLRGWEESLLHGQKGFMSCSFLA